MEPGAPTSFAASSGQASASPTSAITPLPSRTRRSGGAGHRRRTPLVVQRTMRVLWTALERPRTQATGTAISSRRSAATRRPSKRDRTVSRRRTGALAPPQTRPRRREIMGPMDVPQVPQGWRSLSPWPTSAAMTQWLDQTRWWGRQQAMPSPQRMLVDLLEAVAGRFIGRQLTLELRDRRVTLTLDDVRLHTDEAEDADD